MSWYRQYRPTTIAGLHLVSVRQQLQSMLQTGTIPHALLLAGPKGTGKTSTARILAALLNDPKNTEAVTVMMTAPKTGSAGKKITYTLQEPDQSAEIVQRIQRGSSFVVQELDAASNRGIDDIRQLKERIAMPPAEGTISVYILDEVHMLTTEAFNALLKVLEEPPAHAVFMLATTELDRVPATIVSRCRVIQFQRASLDELTTALASILKHQKIEYDEVALAAIAALADGSFRDAVKMLESVAIGKKKLAIEDVEAQFSAIGESQLAGLVSLIVTKDAAGVVTFFAKLRQKGISTNRFQLQLLQWLHQQVVLGVTQPAVPKYPLKISYFLLHHFSQLPTDPYPALPFLGLEIKALELILKSQGKSGTGATKSKHTEVPVVNVSSELEVTTQSLDNVLPERFSMPATPASEVIPQLVTRVELPAAALLEKWDEILSQVRQRNSSIEALLRSARPYADSPDKAQIEVYYQFHREQLQQPKFLRMLEDSIDAVLGGRVVLEFTLADHAVAGAAVSDVSGQVNTAALADLAKDILV